MPLCTKEGPIDRFIVLLIVIGGLASLLLLSRMITYGVGMGGDATVYISTARNLMAGNGLITYEGLPYSDGSAPLYPLTLTFISGLGIEILQVAQYINALVFGLTVFVMAMWVKSRIRSRFWILWAACTCALQTSLAEFAAFAMTEILFVLFVVLSLFALEQFLITRKKSLLVLAAISTAVATLYRYIGVTLIITGLLVIFLCRKSRLHTKLSDATIWFVVASLPLGVWVLRNILTIETLAGHLKPDQYSLMSSLHNITSEFARWALGEIGLEFLEDQLYSSISVSILSDSTPVEAVVIKTAILVCVAIAIGVTLARCRPGILQRHRSSWVVCILFILVYMSSLMIIAPLGDIVLPVRYLIPIFPPVLLVSTIVLSELSDPTRIGSMRGLGFNKLMRFLGVPIVMVIWLLLWVVPNYDSIRSWTTYGNSYASKKWAESEVLAFLRDNSTHGIIYSNDLPALYNQLIDQSGYHVNSLPLDLNDARSQVSTATLSANPTYVVWFHFDFHRMSPNYTIEDLVYSLRADEVTILQDGVIFKANFKFTTESSGQQDGFLFKTLLTDVTSIAYPYFDVYLDNKSNRLIYVRDNCWLNLEDIRTQFVIGFQSGDNTSFYSDDTKYEIDSITFSFQDYAFTIGNHCVAILPLPEYNIAQLRLGEYINDKTIFWKGKVVVR